MSKHLPRRDFLRMGAAAGLAAGLAAGIGSQTLAQNNSKPLRLGVIGVGGRGTYLLRLALAEGVEVPALCDIDEGNLNRAIDMVQQARNGRKPEGYAKGPFDYRRMLQRDDLDAVIVGTPMQVHAVMSVDAMRAGKHVLSEVAAAMTLEDCWNLVRAAEETGRIYMLSENCCYWQPIMMIRNMIQKGLFGELTYAECGYVHDCRSLLVKPDGTLTWRGEMSRDFAGNLYPTHSFGPVAQWLGINRGDRIVSLTAGATGQKSIRAFIDKRFPEGHPMRKTPFKVADSTNVLMRTAKGALIDLRYDIYSPRPVPSTTYYNLQGVQGAYESRLASIWIEGRSKGHQWEPVDKYAKEFEHPMWTAWQEKAKGTGHGGGDFMIMHAFLETVRNGATSPIDVYDAAVWSAVIPLSGQSLAEGGRPVEFPDFTAGKWESRKA